MKTEMIYSKRGVFNKINVFAYVLFNSLMAFWLFSFLVKVADQANGCEGAYADACLAGSGLGGMVGISFILGVWFVFGIIGGLIVYITRPKIVGTKTACVNGKDKGE